MLITCPKCFMRYEVNDQDLHQQRKVWCSNCKHTWLLATSKNNIVKNRTNLKYEPEKQIANAKTGLTQKITSSDSSLRNKIGDHLPEKNSGERKREIMKNVNLPLLILFSASVCVLLAMGLRASFGLFLIPIISDLGWNREIFALALALQNLFWGLFQPFASAAAEKWGTGRIIALGGVLYACGLYMMGNVSDPNTFHISAGLMIGAAQSGCALAVVLGAVSRAMPEERRSWGLGVVMAAGGIGQFTVVPLGQALLQAFNWSNALILLSALACSIILCAYPLRTLSKEKMCTSKPNYPELSSIGEALNKAFYHRGFWLLTIGFYVCGFHVAFIAVHLPAYLTDLGMPSSTGAWALSTIGIFNIFGSYIAGYLGDKYRKKHLLSYLYFARGIVFFIFILTPVSFTSVILFSASLGFLWLSTVPLTSSLVAQIFGARFMGTLFGIVFLSHQVGSFMGIWLGGYFFDYYGSYIPVWWGGVLLGFGAAIIHWPINDRTVVRTVPSY